MKRAIPCLAASIIALFSAGASAITFENKEYSPLAVVVLDGSQESYIRIFKAVERSGARGIIGFPSEAIFAFFPPGFSMTALEGLPAGLAAIPGNLSAFPLEEWARKCLGDLLTQDELLKSAAALEEAREADHFEEDVVLRVPREVVEATRVPGPQRGSPGEILDRSVGQNAMFLIGSVLVNVIFPESSGQEENWTDEEITNALSGISVGFSQYQQHALWVNLSFQINQSYNGVSFRRVATTREPIESNMQTDPIWIDEVLANVGATGSGAYQRAHNLNNATRGIFQTDWVFTAFIADMSNHYSADPPSPDPGCWGGAGYVAYSYLGGPYLLVPFPACRYGPGIGYSKVFIHEMSHTFWALDEYASAGTMCEDRSGYIPFPTYNTLFVSDPPQHCGEPKVPCIMASGIQEAPLPVCYYTQGQVGLVDENNNSKPDIYERAPEITIIEIPGGEQDTLLPNEDEYTVAFRALNPAVPNRNPQQWDKMDVAPRLVRGLFDLNGGILNPIAPSDGVWDESSEDLVFILTGSVPGRNTISFIVENHIGLADTAQIDFFKIGITYQLLDVATTEDSMSVRWITAADNFGAVFDVLRADLTSGGDEVKLESVSEPRQWNSSEKYYVFGDRDIAAGHVYRYRLVARFTLGVRGRVRSFEFPSHELLATALIPLGKSFVSYVMPNPASGPVSFTVNVPKSFYDPTGGGAASSGVLAAPSAREVKTRVEIMIFNVLGQRVKSLYSNARFGGYMSLSWDGADESGRLVPSGVYFISVKAADRHEVRKVVMLR